MALCRSLLADGIPVMAIVRDEHRWRDAALPCQFRIADLADPATLGLALGDADRVVSCAHARHIPRVLEAAATAKRFVFLGSTRKFTRWPDDHGRGVLAGESRFLASGRDGVILHPTMIYGATGEGNVRRLASLLRLLRIVPLPNGGRALVQPIYQDDVTRAVRAALDIAWDGPHTIVIAGPGPVPYAAFVRAVATAARIKGVRTVGVPLAPLMASAWLGGLIPFFPKVRPAELRRLCEDKAFEIGEMQQVLHVCPLDLEAGLARTFANSAGIAPGHRQPAGQPQ